MLITDFSVFFIFSLSISLLDFFFFLNNEFSIISIEHESNIVWKKSSQPILLIIFILSFSPSTPNDFLMKKMAKLLKF